MAIEALSDIMRAGTSAFTAAGGGGTLTSVALAAPSILTVSGSPLTGTGGTITLALTSQTANTFFAAPNGTAGTPVFRAIVAADVPTLNQSTTGSAATLTTGRTISITGDGTYTSGTFDGSANVTGTFTLATVNTATTNAFVKVTSNVKGLITATTTVAATDITTALGATAVQNATTAVNISAGTIGQVLYQSAANTTAKLAVGTTGQVLTSAGAAAPAWTTLNVKPVITQTKTNATTTTETVVSKFALPANSITAGSSVLVKVMLNNQSTGTITWQLRVGANGTIADTLVTALTTSTAQVANAQGFAEFLVQFPTTTTAIGSGFAVQQGVLLGATTVTPVTATVVPTGIVNIDVTATISVAAANTTQACYAKWSD